MNSWKIRGGSISFGPRCLVMGIVNTTPDSFSDGGKFETVDLAVAHAEKLLAEGADILDIGGESSRPGAMPVDAAAELARVLPVVKRLAHLPGVIISVDTVKSAVAKACLEAGAHIVNDIAAAHDPAMANVVREFGAGLVIMHMQGTPRTMQVNPTYQNVVADVREFLSQKLTSLEASGIDRRQVVVDPGIGFGKTTQHNLKLIKELGSFRELNCPLLLGVSRKRFIGEITGKETGDRLFGSLAIAAHAVMSNSAHLLRVHNVGPTVDVIRMLQAVTSVD